MANPMLPALPCGTRVDGATISLRFKNSRKAASYVAALTRAGFRAEAIPLFFGGSKVRIAGAYFHFDALGMRLAIKAVKP